MAVGVQGDAVVLGEVEATCLSRAIPAVGVIGVVTESDIFRLVVASWSEERSLVRS